MQKNLYLLSRHVTAKTVISLIILQAKKFLKCDWLRKVVFNPNLKYLHVKITPVSMVTEK